MPYVIVWCKPGASTHLRLLSMIWYWVVMDRRTDGQTHQKRITIANNLMRSKALHAVARKYQ